MSKAKITPLGDRVLVKHVDDDEQVKGGIIIPDSAKEKPQEAENLSDAEKAAIEYGELFATNHLAINDSIYDNLRNYFSEEEIVELSITVAWFVGFGRLAATYHMVEELPEAFQNKNAEQLTPWNEDSIIVR